MCRERGIVTVVDGAQAAPHGSVDIVAMGLRFLRVQQPQSVWTGRNRRALRRRELLDAMPPYQSGGDMVEKVSFEETTFKGIPEKFEAGTPNISGAIGLAAAFDYLDTIDTAAAHDHEQQLLAAATEALAKFLAEDQGTAPTRSRSSPSRLTAFTLTMSAQFSTAKALPSAPETIVLNHSWPSTESRAARAPRLRFTTPWRKWKRLPRRCKRRIDTLPDIDLWTSI